MTSLPRFSVENPILANLLTMALVVGGGYSALTLVREMFPESRPNQIMITTAYPGASPAEVEQGIALKIEEAIKDVEGVEKIEATITEGSSRILIELESGFDDIEQALRDVENAVDSIPREDFPEDALETLIFKFEPRWPVISVALYGDVDNRTLKILGERFRDDVLELPGITDVRLSGVRKDEISVEVSPAKLVKYGVSFMEVADAVGSSSMDLPGGQLKTAGANVAVRTLGERDWGDDFGDIVVRSDVQGRVVRLRDVARTVDGFEDVDVLGRFLGKPAVDVTVYKTADQDAIRIASLIRTLVAGKTGQPFEQSSMERVTDKIAGRDPLADVYDRAAVEPMPPGVSLATHSDLSRFVESRLDLLERNGLAGLGLVFLALLLLLHWRVAFWVMAGLVLAIAGSVICMKLLGQTLNLISMFGLIIVLGLLVDDAIIVAENVYSKVEAGVAPKLAAIEGTEEVIWPVTCAILTTIVAFVPLMNIDGQMGDWFGVLPVIVCIALSVSLFEAMSILPAHLAHGLRPVVRTSVEQERGRLGALGAATYRVRRLQDRFVKGRLRVWYERLVRTATRYRYVTMAALVSALMIALGVVQGGHVPFVFIQKMDSETLVASIDMDVGAPIARTERAARVVEEAALALDELRTLYTLVGAKMGDQFFSATVQSNTAQLFIELVPVEDRDRTSEDILQELRAKTADIPGVDRLKYTSIQGGPGGAAIQLEISGDRIEELVEVAEHFKRRLAEFAGVFDITDDFDEGRREVQIELFDSARALGLTTESLATQVRAAFYGLEVRKLQRGREDVKIMVRYPPEHRRRVCDIESMYIATPAGPLVPFVEVAGLIEGTGYASIRRNNQRRTVTVKADVDDEVTNSSRIIGELEKEFPDVLGRHPGMRIEFGGQQLETSRAFASLRGGFTVALLLIFVILAGFFRSYVQPLIIMMAIPFALIGAVAGHWLMGYPLTILSIIGLVALTGIVVNDSLILISFINKRIAHGAEPSEAVIDAAMGRLRPILLTSATTVLGLAPLLMEQSFQARFLIPMGISISAGLIFATVLTLLAVPALYLILVDFQQLFARSRDYLLGRSLAEEGVVRR